MQLISVRAAIAQRDQDGQTVKTQEAQVALTAQTVANTLGVQSTGREGALGNAPSGKMSVTGALGVRDHTKRFRSAGVITRDLLSVISWPDRRVNKLADS